MLNFEIQDCPVFNALVKVAETKDPGYVYDSFGDCLVATQMPDWLDKGNIKDFILAAINQNDFNKNNIVLVKRNYTSVCPVKNLKLDIAIFLCPALSERIYQAN